MGNSEQFLMAADVVKKLKTKPDDDELLSLYGLFKQATVGDNNTDAPNFLDFKGKAKHKAWSNHKGLSTYDAEVKYITLVNEMIQKYGMEN